MVNKRIKLHYSDPVDLDTEEDEEKLQNELSDDEELDDEDDEELDDEDDDLEDEEQKRDDAFPRSMKEDVDDSLDTISHVVGYISPAST